MDKKTESILDWGFKGLMALLISIGVHALQDMSKSVDELNVQIARVVEKQNWHEKELTRHDARIHRLERGN